MSANPVQDAPQCKESGVRFCCYCCTPFTPRRSWALFCSDKCRNDFDTDIGMTGKVARVSRRAKGGISVTIHFHGAAAERAINLAIGDDVRATRNP